MTIQQNGSLISYSPFSFSDLFFDFSKDERNPKVAAITTLFFISIGCLVIYYFINKRRLTPLRQTYLDYDGPALLPKRCLITEEVARDKFSALAKEIRGWEIYSLEKKEHCGFYAISKIAKLTANCLEYPRESSYIWKQAVICRDVALNVIQAVGLILERKWCIKISFLISHPDNLRYKGNPSVSRVEGAATAVICHIAKSAIAKSKFLYLESNRFAKGIYQRLGFIERSDLLPEEENTYPMVLSLSGMKALLERSSSIQ